MTDNPALKTCPFCHGSGHKDDAKATLQGVCGNLRNDGYLVPLSVLTRAIEFLPTLEPQGYNEWIDTYKVTNGPYAYSNADMVMAFSAGQASTTGKPKAKTLEALEYALEYVKTKGDPAAAALELILTSVIAKAKKHAEKETT